MDTDLPPVLVLSEVLAVLRISRSYWARAKAAGCPLVPEIRDLPGRYAREAVLACIRRTHVSTVGRRPLQR
jgi:hypothetical protein